MPSTPLTRRQFLAHAAVAAGALPAFWLQTSGGPTDWLRETPLIRSVREFLESTLADRDMTLEFRRINERHDQEFAIQVQAEALMPVASCFKAWLPLYYFLNTPPDQWQAEQGSALYSAVVFSSNLETGTVLADVAQRASGPGNPIEKFNRFLRRTIGMSNGLYSWDWPGSATVGFVDAQYIPSPTRGVTLDDQFFLVDNLFTAADLARGYEVLARGEFFARREEMQNAIRASNALLDIQAPNYRSPIEFVSENGYRGKDGVLPVEDSPVGRVVNDAGIITVGEARYIIAFMSAGESETTIRDVLSEIISVIEVYERSSRLSGG